MGYAGRLTQMLSGLIKTFSPSFPSSGLPTISISGADRLTLLQGFKPASSEARSYPKMKDWQIAQKIAKRHDLDIEVTEDGPEHPIVMQKDQDDLEFLLERAKRVGFDCFIDVDPSTKKDKLYFIKPKDQRDSTSVDVFAYRWGESLQAFTPKMTVGRQFAKVTVRGWDPRNKERIEYTAEVGDLPKTSGKGRTGAEIVSKKLGAKEERIVDIPVTSRDDARKIAIGLLERNGNEFLTGSGEVLGDPALRPGVIVQLDGLGERFSGNYTVRKAEHSFGNSGYMTSFEVERLREDQQPEAPK
jgi:phage protein D